jgi:hypothetical protein
MIRLGIVTAAFALAACGGTSTPSSTNFATVSMTGGNEVPQRTSNGTGIAEYTVNGTTVHYKVTYNNLSGPPTVSHIHVGTPTVSGGVVVGFTGLPNTASGVIEGDFTASNIAAGTAGGVTVQAGNLDSLLQAFKDGNAYTNIHTTVNPGGEIRGQILPKAQ